MTRTIRRVHAVIWILIGPGMVVALLLLARAQTRRNDPAPAERAIQHDAPAQREGGGP